MTIFLLLDRAQENSDCGTLILALDFKVQRLDAECTEALYDVFFCPCAAIGAQPDAVILAFTFD